MASYHAVLKKWDPGKDGRCLILIRITAGNQRRYFSIGEKAKPREWSEKKGKANSYHPDQAHVNAEIDRRTAQAGDARKYLQLSGQVVTAAAIRAAMPAVKSKADFFEFAGEWLRHVEQMYSRYYFKRCQAVLRKFEASAGRPLLWYAFTSEVLRQFDSYMKNTLKNSANTRHGGFRVIRTAVKQAIMDGVVTAAEDPFTRFKRPKTEPTRKPVLSLDEIRRMEELELQSGSWLCVSRDMFVLAFLMRGCRYGDVARLKHENVFADRIEYRMGKSKKNVRVPMVDRIRQILDRYSENNSGYIFPFMRKSTVDTAAAVFSVVSGANPTVNRNLKVVAKMAEIEKPVSTHMSRHSWAFAAKKLGIPPTLIQEGLAHSEIKITQQYLRELPDELLDEALREVTK